MGVTLADVAKAAGVSTATASYAMRGDPQVRPSTAGRVLKAARELNYAGNVSASSLRLGRSGVLGVAVHDLSLSFSAQLASAVSNAAERRGYQTFTQQTKFLKAHEASLLAELQLFCDGTVFFVGELEPGDIKRLSKGKPMVLLDPRDSTNLFDTVFTPGFEGAGLAVDHLSSLGRRRVLVLGAEWAPFEEIHGALGTSGSRLAGVQASCARHGMSFGPRDVHSVEGWGAPGAYQIVAELLQSRGGWDYDSVFCMADEMVPGVLQALAQAGRRVPQDVAVIGFDGITHGQFGAPSVTTVAVDFEDMADKLVGCLVERIESNDEAGIPVKQLMAACSLRLGGTTLGPGVAPGVSR